MTAAVRRTLLVAVVAAALLAAGGCGGGGGDDRQRTTTTPPDPTAVRGGTTALELDRALTGLLDTVGVRLTPVAGAQRSGGQLRFPISGGRLDLTGPRGRIRHRGALRVEAAGRAIEARALEVDATARMLTAEVDGRRVPLFLLEPTPVRAAPGADPAVLEAVLRTPERSVLEDVLGIALPIGGLRVGEVVVSADRP